MIYQSNSVKIPDHAVTFIFSGSGGPGGQNVNRVATAVQLRLNLYVIEINEQVMVRLKRLAGSKLTDAGELLINARNYRTQRENREDSIKRLIDLVKQAEIAPKKRKKTKPTRASKQRRLDSKKRRSDTKSSRRRVDY